MYDSDSPIAGFRRFKISAPSIYVEPYQLLGAWWRHPWATDRPMRAECKPYGSDNKPCKGAPLRQDKSCKCGLHLYYDFKDARERAQTVGVEGYVIACVAGAGRILFDEFYCRCEYAQVLSIVDPIEYPQNDPYLRTPNKFEPVDITAKVRDWAANTADNYGVPMLSYADSLLHAISGGHLFVSGVEDTIEGREVVGGLDDFEGR